MKIKGNTVGTPMLRPDWNQTDPKKSDYIYNKPDVQPGEGKASVQGGIDNRAISEATLTHGKWNFVGLKGYYYSNIDFVTNEITLSTKQNKADANGIQVTWEVGDKVTIVNERHYDRCSTITAINGSVITVDAFPFTEVVAVIPDWDDLSIFVPDKPDAGVVDLGRYSTGIGESNIVTERAATGIGRGNVVQAKYGAGVGRDNIIKAYGGVATGVKNTIEAEAQGAFVEGVENTATAPMAHAGGGASKANATGADSRGYKCEVDGEWGLARNYKTKVTETAPYAVAINEETSAEAKGSFAAGKGTRATAQYQAVFGKFNKPSTNYLFNVGMGTSDTDRANAFAVRKDGITDVFGHRIQNVADAVNALDAVNLQTLNAKAAPAEYGFSGEVTTDDEFVLIIDQCLAKMPGGGIQHVSIMQGGRHSVTIHKHLNGYADIEDISYALAVGFGTYYFKRVRSLYNGIWYSWEWENPPMQPGVEYRTTERWNGKAVYAMLVYLGAIPNDNEKSVFVHIANPGRVVDCKWFLGTDTEETLVFYGDYSSDFLQLTYSLYDGEFYMIESGSSGYRDTEAHALVKYTKAD